MWSPYELLFVFRLTCCHQLVRGPNWKKYQLREVYHHLSIRGGLLAEEIKVDDKKQQPTGDPTHYNGQDCAYQPTWTMVSHLNGASQIEKANQRVALHYNVQLY
ncbi:hypothetical protein T07_4077 [Trichinella nelsoni]|uniref:Uncharacterized protein n=1 Tax=Trichinella nelsoni TaxID=6336 RepID=A0A0V0RYM5_9BILA|nr:hypothetical protein T07_4077 [Trichinella nelsoni]